MRKLFLVLLLLCAACVANAQETLSKSTSLVGIWCQLIPLSSNDDGPMRFAFTGNYKIYNVDQTFLLFVVNPNGSNGITAYGTYKEKGDGEFVEHIAHHSLNNAMSGTKSDLRYKIHNNSMITIEYYNPKIQQWVPEIWKRVEVLKAEETKELRH